METKYWIGIATVVCSIELWLAYIGYVLLGKPPGCDGYYLVVSGTLLTSVIGFWGLAAWDD